MKKDQSEDQKVWSQKTEQVHYTRLSFLNSAGIGCNRTAEQTIGGSSVQRSSDKSHVVQ